MSFYILAYGGFQKEKKRREEGKTNTHAKIYVSIKYIQAWKIWSRFFFFSFLIFQKTFPSISIQII